MVQNEVLRAASRCSCCLPEPCGHQVNVEPWVGRGTVALPDLSSFGETPGGFLSLLSLHTKCDPDDREPDRKPGG